MKAINLIPPEQREGSGSVTGRSGGAALIVLGLIAALAAIALLYGSAQRSLASGRSELATVNAELASARAQVGRLAPYTSFISMADQRAKEISGLVASRFDWSHAFNELGRVLPRTAALASLHGQVGGSAGGSGPSSSASSGAAGTASSVSSSTPPGSTTTFQLTGCATSQSEVANTLQRLRLMDGVSEVALQSSAKSGRSSGASAGSGGGENHATSAGPCGSNGATFSATVTFAPLPAPPAAPSASAIVPTPVSTPPGHATPRRVTVSTKPGGSR